MGAGAGRGWDVGSCSPEGRFSPASQGLVAAGLWWSERATYLGLKSISLFDVYFQGSQGCWLSGERGA